MLTKKLSFRKSMLRLPKLLISTTAGRCFQLEYAVRQMISKLKKCLIALAVLTYCSTAKYKDENDCLTAA